jgi:HPt (histidine-containing phosphotransfer) domain-containing protein
MSTDPTAVTTASRFGELGWGPHAFPTSHSQPGAFPGSHGQTPDLQTLDAGVVASLAALGTDMPGFMTEVVGDFADSVQRHTSGMRLAVLHGDAEGLMFSAHSLKGSCGIIGARRMAALSRQVEENAYAGGDDTLPLIVRLEIEYAAVRIALEAAISGAATSLQP